MDKSKPQPREIQLTGKHLLFFLLVLVVVLAVLVVLKDRGHDHEYAVEPFPVFLERVEAGEVKQVWIDATSAGPAADFHIEPAEGAGDGYMSTGPLSVELVERLDTAGVEVHVYRDHHDHGWGLLEWIVAALGAVVILIVLLTIMAKSVKATGVNFTELSKSPAELLDPGADGDPVRWDEIIGCDEAKTALQALPGALGAQATATATSAGARRVLLEGPTGCGKTMLIRALATASRGNLAVLATTGERFVELFVGVGAKRVRAMFKDASDKRPCIVVIDNADAIGKRRMPTLSNLEGEEREQALHALLEALDGFVKLPGDVGVILATNRADLLDEALVRPGRIDARIRVSLPTNEQRVALMRRCVGGAVPEEALQEIAKATEGASAAHIVQIVRDAQERARVAGAPLTVDTLRVAQARAPSV